MRQDRYGYFQTNHAGGFKDLIFADDMNADSYKIAFGDDVNNDNKFDEHVGFTEQAAKDAVKIKDKVKAVTGSETLSDVVGVIPVLEKSYYISRRKRF